MSSSAITGPVFSDNKRAPSGTAAAPSFAFNDSTGTGVYLVSAGVLGLSTAGVQRVVVDASGNVGIGTASPGDRLHVSSATAAGIRAVCTGATGADMRMYGSDGAQGLIGTFSNHVVTFYTNSTEKMRLDASGNLLVGTTGAQGKLTVVTTSGEGTITFAAGNSTNLTAYIREATGTGENGANAALALKRITANNRSLNAAGTINASGADYAEYMTKAGEFIIAKGDLCGVNAEGKLTNVFSEAVAFVVKSTNPSYVGGDSWGAGFDADSEELEAARQLVDRIAFCGQVPVNVLGATPGQWIIPVEENGAIKGQAVSNPSFEQYQLAVGKVIAIEEDGRARIIVKIA